MIIILLYPLDLPSENSRFYVQELQAYAYTTSALHGSCSAKKRTHSYRSRCPFDKNNIVILTIRR